MSPDEDGLKFFIKDPNDGKNQIYKYPIENACEYIRLNPSAIPQAKDGEIPAKFSNVKSGHEESEINKPKVSIEDAKSQCSDIGFKKGTERFGECVLELMQ